MNETAQALIAYAKTFLCTKPALKTLKPYSAKKLDCSSFTQHVFGKFGVSLPRKARDQATCGVPVDRADLREGDLLFFYVPERFKTNEVPGHVGIYIGDNKMIHCLPSPQRVLVSDITTKYKQKTFLFARWVLPEPTQRCPT